MGSTERRWNPVENEWLLNVPSRSDVPARADMPAELRESSCPFCPSSPEMPETFDIHLLPSKFPVVGQTSDDIDNGSYGYHMVYVYTPDHHKRIVDLGIGEVRNVLDMLGVESDRLSADPKVQAVYIFEVFGDHFGPTVDHPHGQIVGLPFTPRRLEVRPQCTACNLDHKWMYFSTELVFSAVPPYARYPFESVLAPRRHIGRLSELGRREREHLAEALITSFQAFRHSYGVLPPYVMSVVQGPSQPVVAGHLRIELLPLHSVNGGLKRPGGLEIGLGLYTNPVATDHAVEILREAIAGNL